MQKPYLEAGKIVNTHGVRGEVRIQPWADDAAFLLGFRTFYIDGAPVPFVLARIPQGTEVRGNLAAGGLGVAQPITDSDRAAEILMEAAREKEVIVEKAVITVGASQPLFLGEGTRQDYGMIRFDAEPFDVAESYMRLMLEN